MDDTNITPLNPFVPVAHNAGLNYFDDYFFVAERYNVLVKSRRNYSQY